MRTRLLTVLLALLVPAALVLLPASAQARTERPAPAGRGDGHGVHPATELVGQFNIPALKKREVTLTIDKWGYRYLGGGVGNDLTITEVDDGLRYVDRAADRWSKIPSTCRRIQVPKGAGIQCSIPQKFETGRMFLEVWPRLGDDKIDGSTLSAKYRMWVLVDAGNDRVKLGRGDDFANGAFDNDIVSGGAGDDWIRVGDGRNRVSGGSGDDDLVGGVGRDRLAGGDGDDVIFSGEGNDRLRGDDGADVLNGGPGRDIATRDRADRVRECEVIRR